MKRRLPLVLAVVGVLVLALAAAYLYGRQACPPPDWWFRLFRQSGNYGCAA